MKKFSCIACNRTLVRRQPYYPYIFYWVAVTYVSAVFDPRCRDGSRWLFNFRRPSIICQSSASPHVLRLLSLRCRFVPSFFFGLHSAWSNHLWIDFFFARLCPPLLQSKSTSIWVHHILRLSVSAQEKLNAYAIKNIGTFWNFTKHRAPKHLHPNFPEPSWIPEPHRLSARETSTTSPGICIGTLQNLTRYSICTETLRNLTSYLHLNFLEPSCAGTLCNLTGYLQ